MDDWDHYWWLIFPIGFFIFAGFTRWLQYQQQRAHLDLLKTYAQQGKEPPAGLAGGAGTPLQDGPGGYYGVWGCGSGRWSRRGPYWEWRRCFTLGALAIGFGIASQYAHNEGTRDSFFIAAVILGAVALGSLLFALLSLTFDGRK